MIKTRQELFDKAYEMYIPMLEKAAKRYLNDEIYVLMDHVGFACTRMEELFRPLWGIAPLLKSREMYLNIGCRKINAVTFITELMVNGTDPFSERRFDRNVSDYNRSSFANQAVTEIAGYLVSVRFAREIFWDIMSKQQQDQIAEWIKKWAIYAIQNSWPNNHYWYPIICLEVLRYLGYDCSMADEDIAHGFQVLDSLYVDKGWYSDGTFGRFDYYEAWAHHTYTMLWILISDKKRTDYEQRCNTYRRRTEEFLEFFSHYFDEDGGMCAYGRSISYRFAASGAFGLAAAAGCHINYGMAKKIILRNISYFFEKSIPTKDGVLPAGYLYEAIPFVENYTSDGSAYCYTQGFMSLLNEEDSALWRSDEEPMPIEKGDFLVQCPVEGIGVVIEGNRKKNGITLYNNSIHYYQGSFFGMRFNDMSGYYSKFAYNSRSGYSISSRDNVSSENMISLYTPDGRLISHRQEIEMISTSTELLVSRHVPFSNDPETDIVTCLIPLADGYHVRIHKVRLSQSYMIVEGGFSIGMTNDNFRAENGTVTYGSYISSIDVCGDIPFKKGSRAAHPGMHLLAPRSLYPCYETRPLDAGEYLIASTVYFSTDGKEEERPVVEIKENTVSIKYKEIRKTVVMNEYLGG